jgi:hypothetical protein
MTINNRYWLLEEFNAMGYSDIEDAYHGLDSDGADLFASRLYEFIKIEYTLEDMDHVISSGWRAGEDLDSRREVALERISWVQSEGLKFLQIYGI